ncbi:hypothetical protein K7472_15480 [Streptomyces sp. PTM05]|uniref:Large membrane protein n=1 Tax=Streptantibioticus parmotrematis TaxID=2873249 RepID=A0ABS7QSU0_9ACTN|nr:hypothetical protein [Streptantibioticus parmotrematis]MBY8886254.1 hypothetical protein [Streptantibioticus parmotrematis]
MDGERERAAEDMARDERGGGVPPRRRRRAALTVALVTGVVLAGGGGYWAAASSHGPARPAAGPTPRTGPASATGAAGSDGQGDGAPAAQAYRLTGRLPAGPASAHVYRPGGAVSRDQVTRLAAALGVPGTVTAADGLWKAGSSGAGPTLQVAQDSPGGWAFARAGAGTGCAAARRTVSGAGVCYGASGTGGTSAPGGPAVAQDVARRDAAPVLAALGLGGARVDASGTSAASGGLRTVTADPVVGGLPTYGWRTTLVIGPDGRVVSGSGRLAPLTRGAAYPVTSAAVALDQLRRAAAASGPGLCGREHPGGGTGTARSGAAPGPVDPGGPLLHSSTPPARGTASTAPVRGSAPCLASTPPLLVRGAVFGLSARFASGSPGAEELVPSWLFQVAASGSAPVSTVAQSALAQGGGTPPPAPGPSASSSPSPGPSAPAASGTGAPVTSYTTDGRALVLRFWGGLCADYAGKVTGQSGSAVRVAVTATPKQPHRVCPMLARSMSVRVTLARPLGSRAVYDSSDGRAVAAAR